MTTFYKVATPGVWEKAKVDELLKQYEISREALEKIMLGFDEMFTQGTTEHDNTELLMIPTYVNSIPTGKEEGNFFALDLGGTNFRVMLLKIHGGKIDSSSEVYPISQQLMTGTADELFGYIAKCLGEFAIKKLGGKPKLGSVGFTFSFPVKQTSLTSGNLERWTKGFDVEGVVDADISKLLMQQIEIRKEISVDSIALINDTTGTMMSCGFDDQEVMIGLILGTGTNACYMEKLDTEEKRWGIVQDREYAEKQIIVNTEWGAFGSKSGHLDSVKTKEDKEVDIHSLNPSQQIYEKMISGMYLGEIVRLCILSLIKEHVLFRGVASKEIQVKNSFLTQHVSEFCSGEAKDCVNILTAVGYPDATLFECQVIQEVCSAVSLRAARLAAAGLTGIIRRLGRNSLTVAVDGSLFKKHPTFKRFMQQTLDELLPWTRVKLRLSEDGSGRGAALVAASIKK